MKIILVILAMAMPLLAKVDLTTLPGRDSVQLTIYNSADLTLARESRDLTIRQGLNRLQFSWANTLIDPTSLEMQPLARQSDIDVMDLTFPPRVRELGLWNINSEVSGKTPFEISYFTSGVSWRAFYMGTLSEDEKKMILQGYVNVSNNSGEDYENAQVRMVVGDVNLIDRIAMLARRQYAYDNPVKMLGQTVTNTALGDEKLVGNNFSFDYAMPGMGMAGGRGGVMKKLKEVVKESLSEYQLYSIEGTETIRNGWSKRLPSFKPVEVPVKNLYKFDDGMYGYTVQRFISFKNDKEHKLGEVAIPEGMIKVYRNVDDEGHLSYAGGSNFKYVPVNEDVELALGSVEDVVVEPMLMDYKTANYRFDDKGNIKGWDEVRTFRFELKNTRDVPIKLEIKRNFDSSYWTISNEGDYGEYEKIDHDTVKYTIELGAESKKVFDYVLTSYNGSRIDEYIKK
ncbi:MAG: DUF4139 domain-containing protein [Phycisphaerae bacterium]|nr:DUF4139 domain-containing protein [Phycisphaerae bacterium]